MRVIVRAILMIIMSNGATAGKGEDSGCYIDLNGNSLFYKRPGSWLTLSKLKRVDGTKKYRRPFKEVTKVYFNDQIDGKWYFNTIYLGSNDHA